MKKIIQSIIFALLIIVGFVIVNRSGVDLMKIREFIESFGVFSPLIFIVLYAVAVIFVTPATPLSISSGILFGTFFGTIYAVIGATIGALIAFSIARYFGKDFFEKLVDRQVRLKEYNRKIEKHGFLTTLFLRLVPLFPFNALNYSLGLTKVKFKEYAFATFLGVIPGAFIFVLFGDSAASFNIFYMVLSILMFLLLLSIPWIYKKLGKKSD